MRSSVSRASKRSGTPIWLARAIASETRWFRIPFTTSRRSKWRVPALSASRTGLMPQMRFMARRILVSLVAFELRKRPRSAIAWRRDALAAAEGTEPVGALGLDRYRPTPVRPASRDSASRIPARWGARGGASATTVASTFSMAKPAAATIRATSFRKIRLDAPFQRGSLLGKVAPHVPLPRRAEERIADRVDEAVAVGVALEAARVRNLDAAQEQRSARHEPMSVEAVADAVAAHARGRLQPQQRSRPRPGPRAS